MAYHRLLLWGPTSLADAPLTHHTPCLLRPASCFPLSGILSHYEGLLLTELGLPLPRLALSLGASPDTPWLAALPALGPAPGAVVGAAQGVTLFLLR